MTLRNDTLGAIVERGLRRASEQALVIECEKDKGVPSDYINDVILGTGLPMRTPSSKAKGRWTWDYSDISREQWQMALPTIRERMSALYECGVARHISWEE